MNEHRARAEHEATRVLEVAILTVSDTRTSDTDTGGQLICERVRAAGHRVISQTIAPDDPQTISEHVRDMVARRVAVLITTGGTGIAHRDNTIDAVRPLLERKMYGFGELFRMLSYQQVGSAAMLSRALAGTAGATLVFCLPGSPDAVRLALDELILPDLRHLSWETARR